MLTWLQQPLPTTIHITTDLAYKAHFICTLFYHQAMYVIAEMAEEVATALGVDLCVEQDPGSIIMRSSSVTMQFDGNKVATFNRGR